jgi:predicted nucleic acid-binding Zn ribbon protein
VSRPAPRRLASALECFTGELSPGSTLSRVQMVWERVAGPAVAASAAPTAERAGTLTVTCSAAVWAQELDLMAPVLLQGLNDALGGELLSRLSCRTG